MYTIVYDRTPESTEPVGVEPEHHKISSSQIISHKKFCRSLWNMNEDVQKANIMSMYLSSNNFPKPISKAESKRMESAKSLSAYDAFVNKNLGELTKSADLSRYVL